MQTHNSVALTKVEDQPEQPRQFNRNAFVFGFTPQAELWNGRLAMLGFVICLAWNILV
jgi:Chlorophyll A-B binding protein